MAKFVVAFDVYGTLLDTSSVSVVLSEKLHLEREKADWVSALWRRHQLEYTWRLNSMKQYQSFDIVTEKSLRHALRESDVAFNDSAVREVLEAYNILPCFPDAVPMIQQLQNNSNAKIVIFTNGTRTMANKALQAAGLLDLDLYTVEVHNRYKPDPEVYKGLCEYAGKEQNHQDCWLVSGNPFDITGALSFGMRAIFVDRSRKGWIDELLPLRTSAELEPMRIVSSLEAIPGLLTSFE